MKWLSHRQGWFPASYVAPVEDLSSLSLRWESVHLFFRVHVLPDIFIMSFKTNRVTFLLTLCSFTAVRRSETTVWTISWNRQANQNPSITETTARSHPWPRPFPEAPMTSVPSPRFWTGRRSLCMRWRRVRATARSRPPRHPFGERRGISVRSHRSWTGGRSLTSRAWPVTPFLKERQSQT